MSKGDKRGVEAERLGGRMSHMALPGPGGPSAASSLAKTQGTVATVFRTHPPATSGILMSASNSTNTS